MKKCLVFTSLISFSSLIYAALPEQPWLTYPQNGVSLPTNLPAFFMWQNSKSAGITNYRLVVSTDAAFSGYNEKTATCDNKTSCFTDTTKQTNYVLRKTTGTILKNDTNYYWRIEAINASGSSVFDIREFAYGAPTTPIDTAFTVISPTITGTSTDLLSVELGKPIVISAALDTALPAGYSAKVDYGNSLITMTPSTTGANLSATFTKVGTYSYSVGVYDDKNILKSNKVSAKFEVVAAVSTGGALGNTPVLKLVSDVKKIATSIPNTAYAIQLSATDIDGNIKQIVVNWGDGSSDTVSESEGVTRSFTHIYSAVGSFTWTATAYDSGNLASTPVTQVVTVADPVVDPTKPVDPAKPQVPSYSAIDNSGNSTSDVRGWRCSLDTVNNLMWEIKTNDNYLHDKDWTYSWFEPDTTKNGGYRGLSENGGHCKGLAKCNTSEFIKAVNAEKLCGKEDWRLPTKTELERLVVCPNGETPNRPANEISDICDNTNPLLDPYNPVPGVPLIDTAYFPNTQTDWYWTSDTYIPTLSTWTIKGWDAKAKAYVDKSSGALPWPPLCPMPAVKATASTPAPVCTIKLPVYDSAWNVGFYDGHVRPDNKANAVSVRLVSGETTATAAKP
jgi:hypothetical protein